MSSCRFTYCDDNNRQQPNGKGLNGLSSSAFSEDCDLDSVIYKVYGLLLLVNGYLFLVRFV